MREHELATASAESRRGTTLRSGPILVSRLRFLGDIVMSLPLVAALRRARPDAPLHYLADAESLVLLESEPAIDVRWPTPRGMRATFELVRSLRRQRFAAAIDLFANPRSAILVRATGAPVRVGEDRRIRRRAYTLARRLVPGRSAIEQHLDAMRGLGLVPPPPSRPVLRLRPEEEDAGHGRWRSLAAEPGIVLHLAASAATKEWWFEHAVEFAASAQRDRGPVVVTTAPGRDEISTAVARRVPGIVRLPVLPLRELLGFVRHARAVVSVDGAVVHAAVALGRPTVALFGPSDPAVWFPYSSFGPYRVVHGGGGCRACAGAPGAHECMRHITPAQVRAALDVVLEGGAR